MWRDVQSRRFASSDLVIGSKTNWLFFNDDMVFMFSAWCGFSHQSLSCSHGFSPCVGKGNKNNFPLTVLFGESLQSKLFEGLRKFAVIQICQLSQLCLCRQFPVLNVEVAKASPNVSTDTREGLQRAFLHNLPQVCEHFVFILVGEVDDMRSQQRSAKSEFGGLVTVCNLFNYITRLPPVVSNNTPDRPAPRKESIITFEGFPEGKFHFIWLV